MVTPVRKIPLALKLKLEEELKHIVDLDIIELKQKTKRKTLGMS